MLETFEFDWSSHRVKKVIQNPDGILIFFFVLIALVK